MLDSNTSFVNTIYFQQDMQGILLENSLRFFCFSIK